MAKHNKDKDAEVKFIMSHTSRAERIEIDTRSQNTPGTRASQANADRVGTRKAIRAHMDGPAKAAHIGKLSRARRNAARGR